MADKLLKSIKFPTLPDRYVIGDTSLTEEGAAADAKAVGEALATKADTKGTYEDLIVGGAEQLMADGHETDKEPYLFRTTGGSADVGNREYLDKIVGGTVAWNQLVQNGDFANDTGWGTRYATISIADGIATFTPSSEGTVRGIVQADMGEYAKANHKYLGFATVKPSKQVQMNLSIVGSGGGHTIIPANVWTTFGQIFTYQNPSFKERIAIYCDTNLTTSDNVQVRNAQLIDLTALFNHTIADYIYSLEQSQAGAGVAWFRNYFQKDYYPYDPGTLRSVEGVSAHETVGFNQWDEEWEEGSIYMQTGADSSTAGFYRSKYFRILPNITYYMKCPTTMSAFFYDENKAYLGDAYFATPYNSAFTTPPNATYMRFRNSAANTWTPYNNDICINLSDPSRNGEYEPYQKHTYPLDSSLTLRGVPKLADGKLAFDGDVYPPSGEVQRRYGLRAYQSGDESLADAITDGTNTVYKLTTPTTETAEGYEHCQICDPSGTEEFVTTGIVPVGHETRYPHDLKKKIETAPDSPSADGTYLMKRSGGKNTYMALPSTPSANGAYVLTVTVSGGNATYSWTKKE